MLFRSAVLVLVLSWTAMVPHAGANRPWKPKTSIPPAECIGRRRPTLDPATLEKFQRAFRVGKQLLARGRYRQAHQALARATRLHPDHVGARAEHARVLLTLGYLTWNLTLIQQAKTSVDHALRIDPQDKRLRLLSGLLDGLLKRMHATRPRKKEAGAKRPNLSDLKPGRGAIR